MHHPFNARLISLFIILSVLFSALGLPATVVQAAAVITFSGTELLGRPTSSSVTINIVPDITIEYHYEYGIAPGTYTAQTGNVTATGGQPSEAVLSGLTANTRYYYRMQYHAPGDPADDWVNRTEHSFWTQRTEGSAFSFSITSDSHVNIMLGNAATWTQTMTNIAGAAPDFQIDLGDTFAMDSVTTANAADAAYLYQRQFFDLVGHSTPIFLAAGNHEQQEGWHLDDTGSPPVLSTNAQKKYYVNPAPDGFYTGDTETVPELDGDHLREDYYAWTWGDALFVVIDPFWFTTTKPFIGTTGGGEENEGSGNRWDWTLGQTQFNWLRTTLEGSDARYKFVFAHHMTGGSDDYVRGGANPAHLVEWGGYNEAGTTYEWESQRPEWGSEPVHQIFVTNHVSAFFHGHDHQYGYESRDGVVYQALPAAGFSGSGFGIYTSEEGYTIQAMPSPGHLQVSVNSTQTTVDYIATSGATVNYSYAIAPFSEPDFTITATAGLNGSISPAGVVGVVSGANQSFSITPNSGYQVGDVLVDGASVGPVTVYEFTNVVANHTIESSFEQSSLTSPVLDGAVSSGTAASGSSITVNHTTGTGADRLMLAGISWNCGSTGRTISSVTFTPSGGSAVNLEPVITQQAGTQLRYAAIYSLLNPPSGTAGTLTVTFSGSVGSGIVAGAANFMGVNQTTPLGTPGGAGPSSGTTTPTVTLTGLSGSELVFDTVFMGGSGSSQTLTPDTDQSQLWNDFAGNTRAAASTALAAGSSVTMNWTAASSAYWAIAAVPINPAPSGPPTYTLSMAASPSIGGTATDLTGTSPYESGEVVSISAAPVAGYHFVNWSAPAGAFGDANAASTTFTMPTQTVTVTANFAPDFTYALDMAVSPGGGGTATDLTGASPYGPGMVVNISGAAASGYRFVNWTAPAGTFGDPNLAATTFTMPAQAVTVTANFAPAVTLDGAVVTSTGAANASSASVAVDTGTGGNRLMLVGISWNCGSTDRSISSVTFTPSGGSVVDLTPVITQKTEGQLRYAAIYSLLNPPAGVSGTVTVTFSDAVSNGIVVGAANFAGVNQITPLGSPGGAGPSSQTTAPSVTLSGLNGSELVYDTVFMGGSSSSQTLTPASGQNQLWTNFVSNARGSGSVQQAAASSVTMSWTAASSSYWAIAAVAINPAALGPTCYTLTLSHTGQGSSPVATPNQSAACPAAGQYVAGESIVLSGAVPDSGWQIGGWTGTANDSSKAATNTLVMPGSDHAVAVNYTALPTYTITALAGENGSITPSGAVVVNSGAEQAFTIAPAEGYHILDVLVDSVSVGAVGTYTFTNVTADHTIAASFAINTYTITASAGENGSITPSGAVVVNWGANQAFTIAPAEGYHILDVLVDSVSVGAVSTYTFTNVTADHTITASFAINTYTITASAGANGSITPSGAVAVNWGADQAFTIAPAAGYHVADVLVDEVSVGEGGTYTFSNVTANHSIAASFDINTYTLSYTAGTGGTLTGDALQTVSHGGSGTAVTAVANEGYHFVGWSDGGLTAERTDTNIAADLSVTANFEENATVTYTITASAGEHGSIAPSGAVVVNEGASQTFNITPEAGHHVTDVVVDGVSIGANSTYTFNNVTANHTISASFAINTYTLTYTAGTGGTLSGDAVQSVDHGNDGTAVTAVANPGYHFVDWSDGVTTATRTDTNIMADISVTAHFAETSTSRSIPLVAGWNLVSFDLHLANLEISTVLNDISGHYDLVYAYDSTGAHAASGNWMKYDPTGPGYQNTLSSLDETMGFWIHMTAADTLEVSGTVPVNTEISLSDNAGGWNLVAYPSLTNGALPAALSDHGVGTDFSLVFAYHPQDVDQWKVFDRTAPEWSNDLTEMTAGWGYWIRVSADHTWIVVH